MTRLFQSLAAVALLAISAIAAFAHGYKVGALEIGHPYSKAMLAGSQVAGGFMKITNNGSAPDRSRVLAGAKALDRFSRGLVFNARLHQAA